MTLEEGGRGTDAEPATPAATRWSEGLPAEEAGLMPPFIPRRREPAAESTAARTTGQESGESAEQTPAWPGPQATEPEAAATAEPEPADRPVEAFPFDMPYDEQAEPGAPDDAEPTRPAADAQPMESAFDAYDLEAEEAWGDDQADEATAGPTEAEPRELPAEPSPAEWERQIAAAAGAGPAAELAERLESLAAVLRSEGAPALRRESRAEDRITALVAGLLAGYLAGREEL